ncbi:hypothetical protein GJ631_10775 [Natronomonas sp. CBA1123]|uniref:hypothetical protein n=1 Tax=Natronomonas sp. CBA1123 TaxID=2668070 RepID=UPI0012EAA373|nr:hypothetical protein [Natronomonas sp. CBA1123]MUV87038.1 hypothetical protein [Natronomonas sp. CBA1123]
MPEKRASATVPIDEDIQRFAIDLDQRDLGWTVEYLEEMASLFETVEQAGESGIEVDELNNDTDLPVHSFFEYLARNHEEFEQADRNARSEVIRRGK